MLRYLNYPKRNELSPNDSQIAARYVNTFCFYMALLVTLASLGWGGRVAAEGKPTLAKGARMAVFPLDLQKEAIHHTGVIYGAIRSVLRETEPAQLDLYFDRESIQQGRRTFDLGSKKIWNKKGFFSSRMDPNTDYISEIGQALNLDFIMMYSYYVGTNETDHIRVYLVDVRQRQVYDNKSTTQTFDGVVSGVREGYSETVRLTRIVLEEYERNRLPSDLLLAQREEQGRTQPPAQPSEQPSVQPPAVPAPPPREAPANVPIPSPGAAEPVEPRHALTVQTTPADSRVTLRDSDIPYRPGVELPAGRYEILVEREGYQAQRRTVILQDRDLAFSVALDRAGYGLTVKVTPPDSTVEILDEAIPYQPGMILAPGRYQLEIKHKGYKSARQTVRIRNADVTLDVALQPERYDLTVQATPADSRVKLLNTATPYRPGVSLPAGRYEVLVERDGYQAQRRTVMLEDQDVTLPIALARHTYALHVEASPADSRIRLLNLQSEYIPGMALPPGQYHVEVAKDGYVAQRAWVTIDDRDARLNVALAPEQYALHVRAEPADSTIALLNHDEPYRPGVALPPGAYTLRVAREGYRSIERTVRIQDTDVRLDVALEPVAVVQADTEPPTIEITSHNPSGIMHVAASVTRTTIRGYATDPSGVVDVVVNGTKALLDVQGKFSAEIVLEEGRNDIVVTAIDTYRNASRTDFAIDRAPGHEMASRRTALVVGNAAYTMSPLRNPGNDAADMAAKLKQLGFHVMLRLDATRRQIEEAVDAFSRELRQGGVGLFYYAGHGVQVDGQNYLIPLDARLEESVDVKYQTIPAGWVLERMENAGNELNIVILDACRDNPFSRGWRSMQRGLAGIQAARGTLIAYATEPGGVAQDGSDRNGIYTKHLLSYIAEPGWTVEHVFKQVRIAVVNETRGKQVPWESSSLLGEFYFVQE